MSVSVGGVEWLRRAAKADDRVGVVDRSGLLVNVGSVSLSNDPRKVVFVSDTSSGVADVWLDEAGEPDELGYVVVPMTPDLEGRWRLVRLCRDAGWSGLPDAALEAVAEILRGVAAGGGDPRGVGERPGSQHLTRAEG